MIRETYKIVAILLLFVFLVSCSKNTTKEEAKSSDILIQLSSLIGHLKEETMEELGISENQLIFQTNNRDYLWQNKELSFGGLTYQVSLRFSPSLGEDDGNTYLSNICISLPIGEEDMNSLYLSFCDLQDNVMRSFGRPRTYGLEEDRTTSIYGPALMDTNLKYGYIDRFLCSENAEYPGDEEYGGSMTVAELQVSNDPENEKLSCIQLVIRYRTADTISGPVIDGERFYLYL